MSASTPASSPNASIAEDRPLLETKSRGLLMFAVILVSVCQFFDATIANVALPYMRQALGASNETVSWVLTSFMIATAIGTPLTGWLSDTVGSRNLFLYATMGFLISSAACGAATSLTAMIVFRTIQGLCSAFIGPMTMTIMFDISPPSKQATSMSLFGMIVMVAPISGPFVGGLLTEYLNWRWIFYVNLPIGIPAVALIWWLLPSRPIVTRKLDMFGFAAIAIGLGALQLAFDRGQAKDWLESKEIVAEIILAISAFWIFVMHSRWTKSPLFRREIFANGNFLAGLSFMGIMGIGVVGLSAVLPTMFQMLYGYPVVDTGLMMAPRGVGVVITSSLSAMLVRRMDPRIVISAGFVLAAYGMWTMTSWSIEMGTSHFLISSFIQGLGFGLIVSPMNLLAFSTLEPWLRPDGSSLMSLFRSFGGSIGVSLVVTMLSRNQQVAHADLASHVTGTLLPTIDLPAVVDRAPGVGAGAMAMINAEVSRQAMMIAFLDDFYMLTWIILAFAPMIFLLRRPPRAGGSPPPVME